MPTSHSNQLNEIVQIAELLKPRKILDIGIGNGKYGFLLREYIGSNHGISKEELIINGIEGYPEYLTPIHHETYNEIFIQNLSTKLDIPEGEYDLCILIDIIEHFDRETGIEIIKYFSKRSKFMLIATPWDIGDPSIQHDNPLENHIYQWKKKDFELFANPSFIFNRNSLIALIGNDGDKVKFVATKMRHRLQKLIYDYIRRSLKLKRG